MRAIAAFVAAAADRRGIERVVRPRAGAAAIADPREHGWLGLRRPHRLRNVGLAFGGVLQQEPSYVAQARSSHRACVLRGCGFMETQGFGTRVGSLDDTHEVKQQLPCQRAQGWLPRLDLCARFRVKAVGSAPARTSQERTPPTPPAQPPGADPSPRVERRAGGRPLQRGALERS